MSRRVAFVFNPALLSREELRRLFVTRHGEREQILKHLRAAGSSPQHALLIGERGLGKTTLLLRVAHSIDEEPDLVHQWLAVRFDEEQYNIGELADFWLNCLEKIGEDTGDPEPLEDVDRLVQDYKGAHLEESAFLRLRQYSRQHGRRLLLLVDNLDLLLARLNPAEVHRLREILQHEPWLLLVGAATQPILVTFDYDSPFYDFFHVILLKPLSFEEMLDFLRKLGACFHRQTETATLLESRREDLDILHTFTRGNLRTATLLFSLLAEDSSAELSFLLDRLLDQYTSSYKDTIEALPAQGQRVFDALARSWNPATAEDVARELRIERGVASAQLHRLVDRDLAVKVQLPQRSLGFQVRDRFFNLWYLMRGGRRQRPKMRELLAFLTLFYGRQRLLEETDGIVNRLQRRSLLRPDVLVEAEKEARRLLEEEGRPQPALFIPGGAVSDQVRLLALCLRQSFDQAEEQTEALLRLNPSDSFTLAVRVFLLERKGETRAALEAMKQANGSPPPAWVNLERARLSLELGDAGAAGPLLMSLLGSEEIPASEIAALAVILAQRGGTKLGWMAQGLMSKALERSSAEPAVLLASCEVELAQEHPKQALAQFQEALESAGGQDSSEKTAAACLDMAVRLGTNHPNEVLGALEKTGFAEKWLPLAHALAFLGKEPDRLERLSPEMRRFTEQVIDSIQP